MSSKTREEVRWWDYAACNGIEDINIFYDTYETDVVMAMNADQICFHCPVAKQCLEEGLANNREWGVWGGVYLTYGKIDTQRNSHKSGDDWKELERIHGYNVRESN